MATSSLTLHVKLQTCVKKHSSFTAKSVILTKKVILDQVYILMSTLNHVTGFNFFLKLSVKPNPIRTGTWTEAKTSKCF